MQSACYVILINKPQALLPRQINGKYRKSSGKTVKEVIKVTVTRKVIKVKKVIPFPVMTSLACLLLIY